MDKIQVMATEIPKIVNNQIEVCVLPEGKFTEESWLGDERLAGYTKQDISQMVENFEKGLPHYSPFLNIGHTNEKISEVKKVYQVDDDTDKQNGLWAVMDTNEDSYKLAKKYGYVSGEVYDNYLDGEGNRHGKVFAGLALTNRPRHKKIEKNKFEMLVEKMRELFTPEEEFQTTYENNEEENMTNKEFEETIKEKKEEFEAELSKKEEEIKKLETEIYSEKVNVWKAEKVKEGYTPASIDKFVEKLKDKQITFDVANEFISLTDKVDETQVAGKTDFASSEETKTPEELGAEDAKKFNKEGEL